ncbi:MAG TPA: extracellular solute-binding protein [Candidatus Limnocylindrales bacterium]|nr:extracellular solute-binding protein [Candidatus Limnocylindrales bacterium]
MRSRSLFAVAASLGIVVAACSSGATPAPASPSTAPASVAPSTAAGSVAPPSVTPSSNLPTAIGAGEGELDIIVWAGYAEDGSNVKEYDWVHPFIAANADCAKVNVKSADTSDSMVSLMAGGGGGLYDGVSASGDASNTLIARGDVAEVNVDLIPDFKDITPFLQSPAHNTVDGKHYGVSHGWGGNTLMWRTDKVTPAPTSWDVTFDPAKMEAYKGKITAYGGSIYVADAAVYLKTHSPDLGITDPYELTQPQFDAAIALLTAQHPFIGKYWEAYTDEIDNFTTGATVVGTTWPYQTNTLKGQGVKVDAVVPSEGMTGWADTWMLASKAKHPNCMYKWMAWMVTPHVQTQVAEYFGEAPANPKACAELDKVYASYGVKDFCTLYSVNDKAFYDSISFWKTPQADCGDSRGQTCVSYDKWVTAFQAVKAGS